MAESMPRGYRSATEYSFREEQADIITRTAAYHRKDFCLSVIWFPPREHVGIRPSITLATPSGRVSSTGLGSLNCLPVELLHDVLLRLDMHSLFRFRQTNLTSRQLVDSLREYQMVVSHGLNTLCALLRTRLAAGVSLAAFYDALSAKHCAFCGRFAGFMFLLSWERCCFACLRSAPETRVQTLAATRKQLQLTKADAGRLRSFKTLPGIYSMDESPHGSRVAVVSLHQAMSVLAPASVASAQTHAARYTSVRSQKYNFMASCALPYYDRRSDRIEGGVSCAGCQLALEQGIIGSRGEDWASEARDMVYAQDGFLEHFRWCEQAQLLWESSDGGCREPRLLPEGARRGGYFKKRE